MMIIESPHTPPSQNMCYRNVVGKGRAKTQRYRDWLVAFGYDLNLFMRGQQPIKGPYTMVVTIDRRTRHKLSDASNRLKVLEDAIVAHGIVQDDRFAELVSIGWGDTEKGGVRVEIEAFDPAANVRIIRGSGDVYADLGVSRPTEKELAELRRKFGVE